jgi:predicted nucleic acid-binding Zn ribbon protein
MQCGGCGIVPGMERKKKQAGFVHIGRLIDDVLKNYRRESDSELIQVWQIWEGAVGEIIAQNAKPAAFKGRILLVHATSSAWIHQLQFLKKDMIDKLNGALGKPLIDDLKFKVGPV